MSGDDAFDQPTFLHPFETVSDLVLVRREQRVSALERDTDLDSGEPSWPAQDDPPDGTGHAAPFKHEVGDGRSAGINSLFTHDALWITSWVSRF
ncbi:MAG: hypothetical protein P4N60_19350 [Verrucomicrobiae bacterium]|nr:hypothetical protein [Verrucomicrobiae bacterium]